jgi:hypothetical protein
MNENTMPHYAALLTKRCFEKLDKKDHQIISWSAFRRGLKILDHGKPDVALPLLTLSAEIQSDHIPSLYHSARAYASVKNFYLSLQYLNDLRKKGACNALLSSKEVQEFKELRKNKEYKYLLKYGPCAK